jgi:hypothetical protein
MKEMRNDRSYKTSVENPNWKRPLGRPRHRWENNTENDLKLIISK